MSSTFSPFFFPYYSLIASHLNSYYQAWVENVQGSALLAAARTPDASYLDEEGSDDVRMGKRNSLSLCFFFSPFPWFSMYNYIFHHFTRFVPLILETLDFFHSSSFFFSTLFPFPLSFSLFLSLLFFFPEKLADDFDDEEDLRLDNSDGGLVFRVG